MKIIGAGMAGLLAANMLRRYEPEVIEAQPTLPDNHGALLRFRSSAVAEASGQRFRCVEVLKGVSWGPTILSHAPLPAINLYARKVTGAVVPRSVMNLAPSERWIAPDDFTEVLARGLRIQLKAPLKRDWIEDWAGRGEPIISTIPMPVLMKMVGWETTCEFRRQPIWSLRAEITSPPTEVYQTIYYPEPGVPWYRASITNNLLIIESLQEIPVSAMAVVLDDFGLSDVTLADKPELHHQEYGKILPIDSAERRAFILAMTDRFGIYSLGRFGTWRQILLDDLVQDIRLIDRMITERDTYSRHRLELEK